MSHRGRTVECGECGAFIGLAKGFVMRRHVDPRRPRALPRAARLCGAGRTRAWAALDAETSELALAHWAEACLAEHGEHDLVEHYDHLNGSTWVCSRCGTEDS